MYKKIIFVLLSILNILLLFSCKSQNIQINTTLEYFDNNVTILLYETKPGCSKTNFNFTEEYSRLNKTMNNCFIASSFKEYENTIKKYFEMDYFKTITQEYFYENKLIIIVLTAHDSEYYKNGKFEKGSDNNFVYNIGLYNSINIFKIFNKCVYTKIYVYKMEKNN